MASGLDERLTEERASNENDYAADEIPGHIEAGFGKNTAVNHDREGTGDDER